MKGSNEEKKERDAPVKWDTKQHLPVLFPQGFLHFPATALSTLFAEMKPEELKGYAEKERIYLPEGTIFRTILPKMSRGENMKEREHLLSCSNSLIFFSKTMWKLL